MEFKNIVNDKDDNFLRISRLSMLKRTNPKKFYKVIKKLQEIDKRKVEKMENGDFCFFGCTGKKCHWYLNCARKDIGNIQSVNGIVADVDNDCTSCPTTECEKWDTCGSKFYYWQYKKDK